MAKQKLKKIELKKIEQIEYKYLIKYYHFLKFAEDELLLGFKTKEEIRLDWEKKYNSKNSQFSAGAERIVYALLNGKGIGQPNSAPVGADLFFEVEDAYIHIDLKTVGASLKGKTNIGDYQKKIAISDNQNSYQGYYYVKDKYTKRIVKRNYKPNLPVIYKKNNLTEKICLTYFITILFDRDELDVLVISIICMPNGLLEQHYKERVLCAGKNKTKSDVRFYYGKVENFELLGKTKKRVKVVYFNKEMDKKYEKKLLYFKKLYNQKQ